MAARAATEAVALAAGDAAAAMCSAAANSKSGPGASSAARGDCGTAERYVRAAAGKAWNNAWRRTVSPVWDVRGAARAVQAAAEAMVAVKDADGATVAEGPGRKEKGGQCCCRQGRDGR